MSQHETKVGVDTFISAVPMEQCDEWMLGPDWPAHISFEPTDARASTDRGHRVLEQLADAIGLTTYMDARPGDKSLHVTYTDIPLSQRSPLVEITFFSFSGPRLPATAPPIRLQCPPCMRVIVRNHCPFDDIPEAHPAMIFDVGQHAVGVTTIYGADRAVVTPSSISPLTVLDAVQQLHERQVGSDKAPGYSAYLARLRQSFEAAARQAQPIHPLVSAS